MDTLLKYLREKDQLAKHLDISLLEMSPGRARCRLDAKTHHLNSMGSIHGGAIFTLADFTFAAAANSHGRLCVLATATINYVRPSTGDVLFAEAREIALGHKLSTYEVTIRDAQEHVCAVFIGTAYRKEQKLIPDKQ